VDSPSGSPGALLTGEQSFVFLPSDQGTLSHPLRMVDSMKSAPVALLETLSGVDVFAADAPACNRWLGDLKRVQGWVDAFRAQVTARLDALAADGESFGSEATHSRCSGMTARDAAKERERARTLGAADGFADALSEGTVTGAHVDQLAQATANLADEIRAGVFDRSGDLLEQAAATDPGRFGRHVRDLARRLERDAGVSRDAQQRATSYLNITVAGDGMYDVHGRLHPELGARVKRALDHHVAAMIKKGEQAGVAEFVDRTVNRGRLAGEALGELVSTGHGTLRPIVADIGVLVDERTLATGEMHDHSACETTDGAPLPIATVRRLICDAFVTGIVISQDGTPLNVGRTRRTANRGRSGVPCAVSTGPASPRAATCPTTSANSTTSGGGRPVDRPTSTTSCRPAPATTTSSTASPGNSTSHPTAPSRSRIGTASRSWSPPPTCRTRPDRGTDEPSRHPLANPNDPCIPSHPSSSRPCSPAEPPRPRAPAPDH
jgi:hypothetical protein